MASSEHLLVSAAHTMEVKIKSCLSRRDGWTEFPHICPTKAKEATYSEKEGTEKGPFSGLQALILWSLGWELIYSCTTRFTLMFS